MCSNDETAFELSRIMDQLIQQVESNYHEQVSTETNCYSLTSSSSSSSSSDDDDEDFAFLRKKNKKKQAHTIADVEESSDDDDDDSDEDAAKNQKRSSTVNFPKTKGEITLDQLLPANDDEASAAAVAQQPNNSTIKLDESEKLVRMGRVNSIVAFDERKKVIVVQSLPDEASGHCAALNEETVLFNESREAIGKIIETFGPVVQPFFSLHTFGGSLGVEKDSPVFYAPSSNKYTKFIFNIDKMRQEKGSDASWSNDNEPPLEYVDYSDDEQERLAKKQLKKNKKHSTGAGDNEQDADGDDDDEQEEGDALPGGKKRPFSPQKHKFHQQQHGGGNNPFLNRRAPFQKSNSTYTGFHHQQQQQQQPLMPMSPSFNYAAPFQPPPNLMSSIYQSTPPPPAQLPFMYPQTPLQYQQYQQYCHSLWFGTPYNTNATTASSYSNNSAATSPNNQQARPRFASNVTKKSF